MAPPVGEGGSGGTSGADRLRGVAGSFKAGLNRALARTVGSLQGIRKPKAVLLDDEASVYLQMGRSVWYVERHLRTELWRSCLVKDQAALRDYDSYLAMGITTEAANDIDKDLTRTFPQWKRFADPEGQQALRNVLRAYAAFDPEVAYCQGMNFIAGLLLMYLDTEAHAFAALVVLMQERGLRKFYSRTMSLLQVQLWQLGKLIHPKLNTHLEMLGVVPMLYGASWLMTAFSADFPAAFSSRILDVILADQCECALLKVAVTLMKKCEKKLRALNDLEDILGYLKIDVPGWDEHELHDLLSEAFNKPWTTRQLQILSCTDGAETVAQAMDRVLGVLENSSAASAGVEEEAEHCEDTGAASIAGGMAEQDNSEPSQAPIAADAAAGSNRAEPSASPPVPPILPPSSAASTVAVLHPVSLLVASASAHVRSGANNNVASSSRPASTRGDVVGADGVSALTLSLQVPNPAGLQSLLHERLSLDLPNSAAWAIPNIHGMAKPSEAVQAFQRAHPQWPQYERVAASQGGAGGVNGSVAPLSAANSGYKVSEDGGDLSEDEWGDFAAAAAVHAAHVRHSRAMSRSLPGGPPSLRDSIEDHGVLSATLSSRPISIGSSIPPAAISSHGGAGPVPILPPPPSACTSRRATRCSTLDRVAEDTHGEGLPLMSPSSLGAANSYSGSGTLPGAHSLSAFSASSVLCNRRQLAVSALGPTSSASGTSAATAGTSTGAATPTGGKLLAAAGGDLAQLAIEASTEGGPRAPSPRTASLQQAAIDNLFSTPREPPTPSQQNRTADLMHSPSNGVHCAMPVAVLPGPNGVVPDLLQLSPLSTGKEQQQQPEAGTDAGVGVMEAPESPMLRSWPPPPLASEELVKQQPLWQADDAATAAAGASAGGGGRGEGCKAGNTALPLMLAPPPAAAALVLIPNSVVERYRQQDAATDIASDILRGLCAVDSEVAKAGYEGKGTLALAMAMYADSPSKEQSRLCRNDSSASGTKTPQPRASTTGEDSASLFPRLASVPQLALDVATFAFVAPMTEQPAFDPFSACLAAAGTSADGSTAEAADAGASSAVQAQQPTAATGSAPEPEELVLKRPVLYVDGVALFDPRTVMSQEPPQVMFSPITTTSTFPGEPSMFKDEAALTAATAALRQEGTATPASCAGMEHAATGAEAGVVCSVCPASSSGGDFYKGRCEQLQEGQEEASVGANGVLVNSCDPFDELLASRSAACTAAPSLQASEGGAADAGAMASVPPLPRASVPQSMSLPGTAPAPPSVAALILSSPVQSISSPGDAPSASNASAPMRRPHITPSHLSNSSNSRPDTNTSLSSGSPSVCGCSGAGRMMDGSEGGGAHDGAGDSPASSASCSDPAATIAAAPPLPLDIMGSGMGMVGGMSAAAEAALAGISGVRTHQAMCVAATHEPPSSPVWRGSSVGTSLAESLLLQAQASDQPHASAASAIIDAYLHGGRVSPLQRQRHQQQQQGCYDPTRPIAGRGSSGGGALLTARGLVDEDNACAAPRTTTLSVRPSPPLPLRSSPTESAPHPLTAASVMGTACGAFAFQTNGHMADLIACLPPRSPAAAPGHGPGAGTAPITTHTATVGVSASASMSSTPSLQPHGSSGSSSISQEAGGGLHSSTAPLTSDVLANRRSLPVQPADAGAGGGAPTGTAPSPTLSVAGVHGTSGRLTPAYPPAMSGGTSAAVAVPASCHDAHCNARAAVHTAHVGVCRSSFESAADSIAPSGTLHSSHICGDYDGGVSGDSGSSSALMSGVATPTGTSGTGMLLSRGACSCLHMEELEAMVQANGAQGPQPRLLSLS